MKTAYVLSALLIVGSMQAFAEGNTDAATQKREAIIKKREARQEQRIEAQVKKGTLSAEKAKELQAKEEEIKKMAASAQADGKVTKKEFKEISKVQGEVNQELQKSKK